MSAASTETSYTAEDYPGKVTQFPNPDVNLVLTILGFQAREGADAEHARQEILTLISGDHAPDVVEFARESDKHGFESRMAFLYWATENEHESWWGREDVHGWWQSLAVGGPVGTWREMMATSAGRHQYATGQTAPAGPSHFLPLTPSPHFGFKGAYRARLSDSSFDDLANEVPHLNTPVPADSQGKRVVVDLPRNVCFIREGQTWDYCSEDELKVWNEHMNPVIGDWVETLRTDPAGTGCISIRDCIEQDTQGNDVERRSEIAFLLSLGHIEQAARKNPAHLKLMKVFTDMYATAAFTPQMNIWVEVHVPAENKLTAEYVNCHGFTGFLPFFPVKELANMKD